MATLRFTPGQVGSTNNINQNPTGMNDNEAEVDILKTFEEVTINDGVAFIEATVDDSELRNNPDTGETNFLEKTQGDANTTFTSFQVVMNDGTVYELKEGSPIDFREQDTSDPPGSFTPEHGDTHVESNSAIDLVNAETGLDAPTGHGAFGDLSGQNLMFSSTDEWSTGVQTRLIDTSGNPSDATGDGLFTVDNQLVPDDIVDGTADGENMPLGYTDTQGDEITNGDDIILGNAGDDTIDGAGGNDTIDGGDGGDEIKGGAGNDVINGDGASAPVTARESLEWDKIDGLKSGGIDRGDTVTQNTGNVNVSFTVLSENDGDIAHEFDDSDQNVTGIDGGGESVDDESGFLSDLSHAHEGSASYAMTFDEEVSNVDFRINDIDGSGEVTVKAFVNGEPVEVTLTEGSGLTKDSDGDTVRTADGQLGHYEDEDSSKFSTLVEIDGPVDRIEISHSEGDFNSGVWFSDVYFDTQTGGPGDDLIHGGTGADSIDGNEGDDTIHGDAGADVLAGGAGENHLSGGDEDDTFIGGDGADTFDGGRDLDIIDYSGSDGAVNVDLSPADEGNSPVLSGGDADNDSIEGGIDGIIGSDGDDTLTGFDQQGLSDPDVFTNVLDGGAGDDLITGKGGDDSLAGGAGNDTIDGGGGDDVITGGDGRDSVDGGAGDDVITTGGSTPLPDDGFGTTVPADNFPDNDKDTVDGGAGNDSISTGDDADDITGGTGNDTIDGGLDDDTIEGNAGEDVITAGEGSDSVAGGDGDDVIYGGINDPSANIPDVSDPEPDNGDDTLDGGAGNDEIFGEDDSDLIRGGAGNDTLDGGIDDDTVKGGAGDDVMTGGDGNDVFFETAGDGADTITDFGNDSGNLNDGDETNNDLVDLDGFYNAGTVDDVNDAGGSFGNALEMLRADAQDGRIDGVIDGTDYSGEIGDVDLTLKDGSGNAVTGDDLTNDNTSVPCFVRGSLIATRRGAVPVEELVVGDEVITMDSGFQPIRWIGSTVARAEGRLAPVVFRRGAMGNARDLRVSPQHRMLVRGWHVELMFGKPEALVPAKALINDETVFQLEGGSVEYFHVMFDQHELIYSEGIPTESFHPGHIGLGSFAEETREEILQLFPELRESVDAYSEPVRETLKVREARVLAENPELMRD